jgi:plastocyanin
MTIPSRRRGRLAFVLLLGVAALALAAVRESQASEATAGTSAAKTVDINHFAFHPKTLRIKRGGRVAFHNSSTVAHTATRAGSFDTHRIAPGKTVLVRFTHRGAFAYHCKIHPFMKGKVVVE